MWSGNRLTNVQTTTRPDHERSEVLTKIGTAVQKREKQEWANEKPKLDDVRRMRGKYFIDLEEEDKETIESARIKLVVRIDAAMPCKKITKSLTWLQETVARLDAPNKVPKRSTPCKVDSHGSLGHEWNYHN